MLWEYFFVTYLGKWRKFSSIVFTFVCSRTKIVKDPSRFNKSWYDPISSILPSFIDTIKSTLCKMDTSCVTRILVYRNISISILYNSSLYIDFRNCNRASFFSIENFPQKMLFSFNVFIVFTHNDITTFTIFSLSYQNLPLVSNQHFYNLHTFPYWNTFYFLKTALVLHSYGWIK